MWAFEPRVLIICAKYACLKNHDPVVSLYAGHRGREDEETRVRTDGHGLFVRLRLSARYDRSRGYSSVHGPTTGRARENEAKLNNYVRHRHCRSACVLVAAARHPAKNRFRFAIRSDPSDARLRAGGEARSAEPGQPAHGAPLLFFPTSLVRAAVDPALSS